MQVRHRRWKVVAVTAAAAALVGGGTAAAFATSAGSTATVATTAVVGAHDPGDFAAFNARFAESTAQRLARLAVLVSKFQTKVDALPTSGLTITPRKARLLKHLLSFATDLQSGLAALPTSGPGTPTAAEQATIASLQTSLGNIRTHLAAVLANATIAASTTKVASTTKTFDPRLRFFFGLRWWDRRAGAAGTGTHHCDGSFHR